MNKKFKNIHMIGIGGIGMSGIAKMLLESGMNVSGCDPCPNALTAQLSGQGAVIYKGHSPDHIGKNVDLLVHTSAVKNDHPEIQKAKEMSIPVYLRAQMLAELVNNKYSIAVTGTHGKTTVSFMITSILNAAGLSPSFIIGGEVPELGGNERYNNGEYFVLEADESDGSQVYYRPRMAVLTNIDRDHLENYEDGVRQITGVMEEFLRNIRQDDLIVGCGEDKTVREIFSKMPNRKVLYGFNQADDIYADNIILKEWYSEFNVVYKNKLFGTVSLGVPGMHNVLNALAAVAAAMDLGINPDIIKNALKSFNGVKRRLDILYKSEELLVLDDYAHHPAEIKAVLETARNFAKGRLIAVFQPHRFTRTKFLGNEFAPSFKNADLLILTDIYSAGEKELPGINGRIIYNGVVKQGQPETVYLKLHDITDYLDNCAQCGDAIVFMGAGDITDIAHKFSNNLKTRAYR